jgi:hypothetical protein
MWGDVLFNAILELLTISDFFFSFQSKKPTNALTLSVFKKHTLKYLKAPTCFGLRPSSGSIHHSSLILNVKIFVRYFVKMA